MSKWCWLIVAALCVVSVASAQFSPIRHLVISVDAGGAELGLLDDTLIEDAPVPRNRIYVDADEYWLPVDSEERPNVFPLEFRKAIVLHTEEAEADSEGDTAVYTVTVDKPSQVCVWHSDGIDPKPMWLSTYEDIGYDIEVLDFNLSGLCKEESGEIDFGGNWASDADGTQPMYLVTIQPAFRRVAEFEEPPVDTNPGNYRFTNPTLTKQEQTSSGAGTTNRVNGSDGAVSVEIFDTGTGTCEAGTDYTSITPTTVSWDNGELGEGGFITLETLDVDVDTCTIILGFQNAMGGITADATNQTQTITVSGVDEGGGGGGSGLFPGPPEDATITLTTNHGLTSLDKTSGQWDNEIINAQTAQWTVANSKNANPTWGQDCNVGSLPTNPYPWIVRAGNDNFYIWGGIINSNVPQTSEWKPTYCNSAAFISAGSDNITLAGTRVVGAWDAYRMAQDSLNFTIEHLWATNIRDDCVENDQLRSGTIRNSLFDGCMSGISTDQGASDNQGNQQFNHTVTMDKVLIRMKKYPWRKRSSDTLQQTHGHVMKGTSNSPSFRITNNVWLLEDSTPFTSISRLDDILERTVECSNNIVLFPNDSSPPSWASVFSSLNPGCWTIQTGSLAQTTWNTHKQDWIDCHPNNPRVSGDPGSTPANCDIYGL